MSAKTHNSPTAVFPHKLFWPLCGLALLVFALISRDYFTRVGPVYRQSASQETLAPLPGELPAQITNLGNGRFIWSLRSTADMTPLNPGFIEAIEFIRNAPALAAQSLAARNSASSAKVKLAPLLNQDGATPPKLLASIPENHGESLDLSGRPLRWQLPGNVMSGYSLPRPVLFALPPSPPLNPQFAKALARLRPSGSASAYRALVENYTRKYNLSVSLVMAIIHSESHFQPTLVSPRSAMGLMQVLPSTANGEVHRFLYGRRGQVTFEDLAVPEINISYGTAYLHILFSRYFAGVKDPQVRESCVIASYNLGPNRFLRLYGGNNDSAVAHINSMTPEQFHHDLPTRLPVRETRFYVEKVRRMKEHYGALGH